MTDPLARLLAQGERATFHGSPIAALQPLHQAVQQAVRSDRGDEAAAATWLLGVAQGAAGRYGTSMATLDPLVGVAADDVPERRLFAGLAQATVASLLRQLGRHADAQQHDRIALDLAGPEPLDPVAFDARLGLAADAIGAADAETAAAQLAAAEPILAGHPEWWRQRVRHGWVAAELALLQDRPADAHDAAMAGLALAEQSGAPRHVAKSLLVVGVASVQLGDHSGVDHLRRAAALAESLGAVPLIWPTRALLAALLGGVDPAAAESSLTAARSAVLLIAEDLSGPLRADWLARDDIAALAGDAAAPGN